MQTDITPTVDVASRALNEPLPSNAIAALGQATRADAVRAFKDAVADYARAPNATNERKVEMTLQVLRRHRQHVAAPYLAQAA